MCIGWPKLNQKALNVYITSRKLLLYGSYLLQNHPSFSSSPLSWTWEYIILVKAIHSHPQQPDLHKRGLVQHITTQNDITQVNTRKQYCMARNFEAHTFTVWRFENGSWAICENHKHCGPRKNFCHTAPFLVLHTCVSSVKWMKVQRP